MKQILTERPNLLEPNVYITICTRIKNCPSPNRLVAAGKDAYCANESTMSKIVLSQGTASYERLTKSGCTVEITQKDWINIVKENEKIPFSLETGELIRSFVIPATNNTLLVIMAHHLVGDGKSIIYFLKDVIDSLSGKKLLYKPLTVLTKESFSTTKLPISARLYTLFCKKKWDNTYFTWKDYYHLHNTYWANTVSEICYKTLSKTETKRIQEKCKQLGCSVNSYIVACFLQADTSHCTVGIPVSIRKPGNTSMTNLTSGISITHQFSSQKTFAKNAQQIHRKIHKGISKYRQFVLQFLAELPPTLVDAVLLYTHHIYDNPAIRRVAHIMGYTKDTKQHLGITNLTVLDIPTDYGTYKLEDVTFVPPAVSYARNVIGVSTINGKMTLTYHHMKNTEHSSKMLFEQGIENLIKNSQ